MSESRENSHQKVKDTTPAAGDRASSASPFHQELNNDRDRDRFANERDRSSNSANKDIAKPADDKTVKGQHEKPGDTGAKQLTDTADAARHGDYDKLSKGIAGAYEHAKGDPTKLKEFGKQLGDQLKDSGIKVESGDNKISFSKDGKSVDFKMKAELDFNSAGLKASVNIETSDGRPAKDVVNGFAKTASESPAKPASDLKQPGDPSMKPGSDKDEKQAAPAEKQSPISTLTDPKASAQAKLLAAQEMAHNGQTKFSGPDGRNYSINTQSYGHDKEGVVVSTTGSKGDYMPVLRGIVNNQDGSVTHQRDSHGREVNFAGDRAKKLIANDSVLSSSLKPEAHKPEAPKPEPPKPEPPKPEAPKSESQKPEAPKPEAPAEKTTGPLGTDIIPVDQKQPTVSTRASVYGDQQGTSSGRPFRAGELTAAFNPEHLPKGLNLKFGDVIRVSHDGKSVDVTLTDHGPYVNGRGIDLSTEAGRRIGITASGIGVGKVTFEKIGNEPGYKRAPHRA